MATKQLETTTIPQELRDRRQWVVWVYKDGTKIPKQINGRDAKVNTPDTWCSFDEAVAAADRFEGIAYVITADDPYTGIDLDNCIDQRDQLREWAIPIVAKLVNCAYGEVSPSGRGIKFITHAEKLEQSGNKKVIGDDKQQIEVYDGMNRKIGKPGHRFWTITSDAYQDATKIGFGMAAVGWICETYLMGQSKPKESKSRKTRNGTRTSRKSRPSVRERASKYVAKMDPSISGQGGHDCCFAAACALVIGFDLPKSDAFAILKTEFNKRCKPPWSDAELQHKVDDADALDEPRGKLLDGYDDRWDRMVERIVKTRSPAARVELPKNWISLDEHQTDNFLARYFIDQFGRSLRYVPDWKKWLVWSGRHWEMDPDGTHAAQLVRKFVDRLWQQLPALGQSGLDAKDISKIITLIRHKNSDHGIKAISSVARSDKRVRVGSDQLNPDLYLLNLANGTYDLSAGEFREHDPNDLITVIANVAYGETAECPEWDKTMNLVFAGDAELISYTHQIFGYSLTGDIGESILPIAYGSGANGKSTIWNTIVDMLGGYAGVASESLLLGRKHEHDTIKAALFGKRLMVISEPEQGAPLREARMKELTGDEFITARRMNEDPWTFRRSHTFWMACNHLPKISGTDQGVWRRIKRIPFTVDLRKIEGLEVRPGFHKWLVENEGPGILNRLIDGYAAYAAAGGFLEPVAVRDATEQYKADEDPLGEFWSECVTETPGNLIACSAVYGVYRQWATASGIPEKQIAGNRKFTDLMRDRCPRERVRGGGKNPIWHYLDIDVVPS